MYKLHTLGNSKEIIKGSFYEHELTPTELEKLYIEKILRNNKKWTLVKWSGHSVPTWEPRKYIQDILKKNKLLKVKNIVNNKILYNKLYRVTVYKEAKTYIVMTKIIFSV